MRLIPYTLTLAAVALTLISTTPARAGAMPFSERPLWFGLGVAGGAAPEGFDPSGVGYFHLTVGLRIFPVVPELTLREGIRGKADPQTHVGGVAFGARFLLPQLLFARGYLRVAFSHQHEIQWQAFLGDPLKTIFGVNEGINHRSGFEAGGGLEVKLGPKGIVGLWAQGTLLVFPETAGPPVTAILEGGISFGLGPRLGGG